MLMTENWQPSVLQLTPFGSNDASSQNDILYHEERVTINRAFPRLAVTRFSNFQANNKSNRFKVARSASECASRSRQQCERPTSLPGSRSHSEFNSRTKHKQDGGYSVKDLNDQIIYSANTDIITRQNSEGSSKKSWLSSSSSDFVEAVKYLPKPNASRSLDGRYFLPKNGFWRAVTLTPGEIDLRKQKVYQDTKLKKQTPKNKVNVNSLPRSNTPINDYDPDKLNMKNVVAFLQKNNCNVTIDSPRSTANTFKNSQKNSETRNISTNVTPRIKTNTSELKKNKSGHHVRMSEQVPTMENRFKRNEQDYKIKYSKDNSTRSVRQFRLHRFLTMASQDPPINDAIESKAVVVSTETTPKIKNLNLNQDKSDSGATCAIEDRRSVDKVSNVIRLPNMQEEAQDFGDDFNNDSASLLDAIETVANAQTFVDCHTSNSNLFTRKPFLTSMNSNLSKKIPIHVPDYKSSLQPVNDKVRLSLRRERYLTREHTYMSDLSGSQVDRDHRESRLNVNGVKHDNSPLDNE